MEVLERTIIEGKEYICMQKLLIEGSMVYVCREVVTRKIRYFKEGKTLEEVKDEATAEQVNKLIYAKSLDYVKN